ncbi:MAG: hypothetical protein K2N58_03065 [Treponemataceae bacterium]|nr:hypothetical protein [Treponemataceae bacterium]
MKSFSSSIFFQKFRNEARNDNKCRAKPRYFVRLFFAQKYTPIAATGNPLNTSDSGERRDEPVR